MLDLRSYGRAKALHAHDFVQVVMPLLGVLEMEVDGRGGRVDDQHAAVIPEGAVHAFEATGRNRFIVLDVAGQAHDKHDLRGLTDRVFVPLTPGLRALTTWLHNAPLPDGERTIADGVADAWASLALSTLAAHPANGATSPRVRFDPRAERVWQAIDRRFSEALTVDELAADVGLSGRRLATLFRETYGITVHARLSDVRLQHAVSLLRSSTLPIAVVAARSGYYDQSALTRHLKAAMGKTPAALRRI